MTKPVNWLTVEIPGKIVSWKRSGGGKGTPRFTPAEQRNYMGAVRMIVSAAMSRTGLKPLDGPILLVLTASYLHPASWSAKRRAANHWKTSAPDVDNLAKLTKDALNKMAWVDDARVAFMTVQKIYGASEKLVISIASLEGYDGKQDLIAGQGPGER